MQAGEDNLKKMIGRVARHQEALGLGDTAFVARYQRHLGSTDSWRRRLMAGKFAEIDIGKWIRKLTALVAEIDGGSRIEEYFPAMPVARKLESYYQRLQGQTTDRRCVVMLGVTGVGKTTSARAICAANPRSTAFVRANETWKESKMQIAIGLARALGVEVTGRSAAAVFHAVLEELKAHPITIFIDEAHEGGILLFKLVKTLIDETQARFVLLSYPTKWRRLVNGSDDAHAEAQQLFGRTLKPVLDDYASGTVLADLEIFLRESVGLNGEAKACAVRILPEVRKHGNLRLMADALDLCRANAEKQNIEIDAAMVIAAVEALCPVRKGGAL